MTRDELMELYRRKISAQLRLDNANSESVRADKRASETMLEKDIEAGFEAEMAYSQAYADCEKASAEFRAARTKYMAELGNPVGRDAKGDAKLRAALGLVTEEPERFDEATGPMEDGR